MPTLKQRHAEITQSLILEAARKLISEKPVAQISLRSIAESAGISERTIYRHFATRDALLDALAAHCAAYLASYDLPRTLDDLRGFARVLFHRFEEERGLTIAMLDTELFGRVFAINAARRKGAIEPLLAEAFPHLDDERLQRASPLLYYLLSATCWRYLREQFQMPLAVAIASVEQGVDSLLDGLANA